MYQHRAREDELIYLKLAQPAEQVAGATHGDGLVLRARLTGEIVVGGEMDHGGDVRAGVGVTHPLERGRNAGFIRQVHTDAFSLRWRMWISLAVEADHRVVARQPANRSRSDEPAATGQQDDGWMRLRPQLHYSFPGLPLAVLPSSSICARDAGGKRPKTKAVAAVLSTDAR